MTSALPPSKTRVITCASVCSERFVLSRRRLWQVFASSSTWLNKYRNKEYPNLTLLPLHSGDVKLYIHVRTTCKHIFVRYMLIESYHFRLTAVQRASQPRDQRQPITWETTVRKLQLLSGWKWEGIRLQSINITGEYSKYIHMSLHTNAINDVAKESL